MSNLSFWEKLNKLREIKLDEKHRVELRSKLIEYIERYAKTGEALRLQSQARAKVLGGKKPVWSNFLKNNSLIFKPMPIIAGLIIVLMAGGGVSFAAENSLPGDVLYPIKINVNEEVRGAVSLSSGAKAEWEARRAERRIEEAEELAAKGDLSAEITALIEENFDAHAKRVEDKIVELESKNKVMRAADLASKFEISLRVHDEILGRLVSRTSAEATQLSAQADSTTSAKAAAQAEVGLGPIKIKVGKRLNSIAAKRMKFDSDIKAKGANVEAKTEIKVAAEGKIGAAKNFIASVNSFIESQGEKLGAGAAADAEARLTVAEGLVARAESKVAAEEYGDAFNLANEAIRVAQAAKLLVSASTERSLKVRFLGPIEVDFGGRGELDADSDESATSSNGGEDEDDGGVDVDTESEAEVRADNGIANSSSGLKLKIGL